MKSSNSVQFAQVLRQCVNFKHYNLFYYNYKMYMYTYFDTITAYKYCKLTGAVINVSGIGLKQGVWGAPTMV